MSGRGWQEAWVATKRRTRSSRPRRKTQPAADEAPESTAAAEPQPDEPEAPLLETAPPAVSAPEAIFAARVPPPLPPRPAPATRRAVFFDVENTSRAEHIARVLEHLRLDWISQATELVAVGNWRVVGHETARLLAQRGAHLVHSAPATGVRDWSDLRIAVAAGVWLASARPGDAIEIITDDQAFDAVGDVATSLGIAFRRLSYRALAGVLGDLPPAEPAAAAGGRSSRRRRRGGRRGRYESAPRSAPPAAAPPPPAEPHTAPQDELVEVARSLIVQTPDRTVSLDALSNALKARGFRRPPGSLRLITRLRRIKELDVSRTGMIRLVDETVAGEGMNGHALAEPADAGSGAEAGMDAGADAGESAAGPSDETGGAAPAGTGRRRRRRGGRRRRGRGGGQTAAAAT
jgi:hypothetical protein